MSEWMSKQKHKRYSVRPSSSSDRPRSWCGGGHAKIIGADLLPHNNQYGVYIYTTLVHRNMTSILSSWYHFHLVKYEVDLKIYAPSIASGVYLLFCASAFVMRRIQNACIYPLLSHILAILCIVYLYPSYPCLLSATSWCLLMCAKRMSSSYAKKRRKEKIQENGKSKVEKMSAKRRMSKMRVYAKTFHHRTKSAVAVNVFSLLGWPGILHHRSSAETHTHTRISSRYCFVKRREKRNKAVPRRKKDNKQTKEKKIERHMRMLCALHRDFPSLSNYFAIISKLWQVMSQSMHDFCVNLPNSPRLSLSLGRSCSGVITRFARSNKISYSQL